MRHAMRLLIFVPLLVGCATWGEPPLSQAAITQLETRTIDAPFEKVYEAAIESLFDLGYTLTHSDKESGVVVGEKQHRRAISIFVDENIPQREFDAYQVTLLIRPEGKRQSTVRIKTSRNKERRFDKAAINEVWVYIERQVLMH
ncbi:MAG: hypothetical protein HYV02_08330 [Deltaproteobacteria bacterium]|nr:hypothetical protein [Deltaproteobacteria bacterium]